MSPRNRSGAQVILNVLNTVILILGVLLLIAGVFFIYVMDKDGADGVFQIIQNTEGSMSQVDAIKNQAVTLICYAVVDVVFAICGKMASHDSRKLQSYSGMAVAFLLLNVYTLVEHYVLHVNLGFYFFPVAQIAIFAVCWALAKTIAAEQA